MIGEFDGGDNAEYENDDANAPSFLRMFEVASGRSEFTYLEREWLDARPSRWKLHERLCKLVKEDRAHRASTNEGENEGPGFRDRLDAESKRNSGEQGRDD